MLEPAALPPSRPPQQDALATQCKGWSQQQVPGEAFQQQVQRQPHVHSNGVDKADPELPGPGSCTPSLCAYCNLHITLWKKQDNLFMVHGGDWSTGVTGQHQLLLATDVGHRCSWSQLMFDPSLRSSSGPRVMYITDIDAHSCLPSATTSSLLFADAVRHTASGNTPRDCAAVFCCLYGLK
jgi:hypothetical protein